MSESLRTRLLLLFHELELVPGSVLPTESELVLRMGASRQAVREALVGLEALGVVVSRQGARRVMGAVSIPSVIRTAVAGATLDADSLRNLLEVRRVLEAAFFPVAAAAYTPQTIARLRSFTDRMEAKAARGETSHDEDALFHRELYARLDNDVLIGLIESFWDVFHAASPTPSDRGDLQGIALSHSRIVDALEAGDIAMAAHALNIHFFEIRGRLKRSRTANPTHR
ncbi:MAG: FCD domain-containing protein [Protaetiibacter sp.]